MRAKEKCLVLVWQVDDLVSYAESDEIAGQALLRIFNEALVESVRIPRGAAGAVSH